MHLRVNTVPHKSTFSQTDAAVHIFVNAKEWNVSKWNVVILTTELKGYVSPRFLHVLSKGDALSSASHYISPGTTNTNILKKIYKYLYQFNKV